jgi:hypothetical protein
VILSGCSTSNNPQITATTPPSTVTANATPLKDPYTVKVYSPHEQLLAPYKVIGQATISKFKAGGIKRQKACIQDSLRNVAAAMGGDAVIDLALNDKTVTGTVIAYPANKKIKNHLG